jgi:hypothetical protein
MKHETLKSRAHYNVKTFVSQKKAFLQTLQISLLAVIVQDNEIIIL